MHETSTCKRKHTKIIPVSCSCAHPYLVYFFSVNIRETSTSTRTSTREFPCFLFLCLSLSCLFLQCEHSRDKHNNFIVSLVNCVRVFSVSISRVRIFLLYACSYISAYVTCVNIPSLFVFSCLYLTCVDNSSLCMFLYLCLSHACELNIHSLCLYLCLSHKCEPCLKI